jgi:chromosome segregation ATPase
MADARLSYSILIAAEVQRLRDAAENRNARRRALLPVIAQLIRAAETPAQVQFFETCLYNLVDEIVVEKDRLLINILTLLEEEEIEYRSFTTPTQIHPSSVETPVVPTQSNTDTSFPSFWSPHEPPSDAANEDEPNLD